MGEIIFDKIEERFEEKKEQALQESILNNPKVRAVYEEYILSIFETWNLKFYP